MKHVLSILILFFGIFVFRSAQGQWVQTNGPYVSSVSAFAVLGEDLFAGTFSGAFLSVNNGSSWNQVDQGLTFTDIRTFAVDGSKVFMGTIGGGIFVTIDAGSTWSPVDSGLTNFGITALANRGDTLFAGATNTPYLFVSTDAGKHWYPSDSLAQSNTDIFCIALSGQSIFVGTASNVLLSTNNGTSWTKTGAGQVSGLLTIGSTLLAAGQFGPEFSIDNGATWNNGIGCSSYTECITKAGSNVFIGTESGVYLSTDSGRSWNAVNDGLVDRNVNCLAVKDSILFAGTDASGVWRRPLSEMIHLGVATQAEVIKPSLQCYPNPFSGHMTITFSAAEGGHAEVSIVNLLGKELARLFDGELSAGEHAFNWDGNRMPPGAYLCCIRQNDTLRQLPLMVVK